MTIEEQMRRLIGKLIHHQWLLVLCGSPTPDQEQSKRRSRDVRPGDWVVELSTFHRNVAPVCGRFILKRREVPDDVAKNAADWGDEPLPTYDRWYIETPAGTLQRWWNCEFVAAACPLLDSDDVDEPATWARAALSRHGL